jgi:hypothetical protein
MKNEFPKYKAAIDKQMAEQYPPADNSAFPKCSTPFAPLEFGIELRVIVPWAYKNQEECERGVVHTRGVQGSTCTFSATTTISIKRRKDNTLICAT